MIHKITFDYSIPNDDYSKYCCKNCLFNRKNQIMIYCSKNPYAMPIEKIIDCNLKEEKLNNVKPSPEDKRSFRIPPNRNR